MAVTPCGANTAPSTCPSLQEFPPNYLGSLNPWTGAITPVSVDGADFVPQDGLLFMPFHQGGRQPGRERATTPAEDIEVSMLIDPTRSRIEAGKAGGAHPLSHPRGCHALVLRKL